MDVMNPVHLKVFMESMNKSLEETGIWLCSDFYLSSNASLLKRMFVKLMYTFFRIFSNLEGNKLLDFELYFKEVGFKQVNKASFYFGMIDSCVWTRNLRRKQKDRNFQN